jgi:hypothetical protein
LVNQNLNDVLMRNLPLRLSRRCEPTASKGHYVQDRRDVALTRKVLFNAFASLAFVDCATPTRDTILANNSVNVIETRSRPTSGWPALR